jgi:hypothetical protein
LGPPSGNHCSPVFMSECCGFTAVPEAGEIIPCNALDKHFEVLQASNAMGLSREKAAKQRKEELKKEKDASELSSLATVRSSSSSQSQMIINLEMRKERRLLRTQEIERLTWLIQRAADRNDRVKKDEWQLKLELLYESPLETNDSDIYTVSLLSPGVDTLTPRSTPTPVLPACSISVCSRQPFSPISVSKLFQLSQDKSTIEESNLLFVDDGPSPYYVEDFPVALDDSISDSTFLQLGQDKSNAEHADLMLVDVAPSSDAVENSPVSQLLQLGQDKSNAEHADLMLVDVAPSSDAAKNSLAALENCSLNSSKVVEQKERQKAFEQSQQMKHQKLFVQKLLCSFKRINIPKDGHCLFHCFAIFFNRHGLKMVNSSDPSDEDSGVQFSPQIVRNLCADELIRLDGKIPGLMFVCIFSIFIDVLMFFCFFRFNPFDDGDSSELTSLRDEATISLNVRDYAESLRTNLYGGDLEIATLAWLFKIKVSVYSHYQWKGSCDELRPEVHVQESDADDPEGGEIHILFEHGMMSGGSDHYSLIVPSRASRCEFALSDSDDDSDLGPKNLRYEALSPLVVAPKPLRQKQALLKESEAPLPKVFNFQKHAFMTKSLPRWNIDIKVVDISPSVGRGIVAMRNFHKKEVVGIYDGHRCDDNGMML